VEPKAPASPQPCARPTADVERLLAFVLDGLIQAGSRILSRPPAGRWPFRITFEAPRGQRAGVMVYAVAITPPPVTSATNEHQAFKLADDLVISQDPVGLFTTLLIAVDLDSGVFISADAALHAPTPVRTRYEVPRATIERIRQNGWDVWEHDPDGEEGPTEVLIGARQEDLYRAVLFESVYQGLPPGDRHLMAEKWGVSPGTRGEVRSWR